MHLQLYDLQRCAFHLSLYEGHSYCSTAAFHSRPEHSVADTSVATVTIIAAARHLACQLLRAKLTSLCWNSLVTPKNSVVASWVENVSPTYRR